ncbi:hypothetical protein KKD52_08170 [Myxococcota bacterium]|nr:hypothetical protein [Myxococcota bacterium]MBU1411907.1 hypothetical protein [Myxococcota bacterium]MBU1510324.1 hypothetical protein [Myxococcota bacterium]
MNLETGKTAWFHWLLLLTCVWMPAGCKDPCEGVDCSGHGDCKVDKNDNATCECDPGYENPFDTQTLCLCSSGNNIDNKPVIYLYPVETTRVQVAFAQPQTVELSYSYPAYPEGGWDVIAHPDGRLVDPVSGQLYYTLFWEGTVPQPPAPAEGFVVAGADTAAFLERSLAQLGLSWEEADEFIIYWLPILGGNPYNFIQFATTEYDRVVPLSVVPAPDTRIRISMKWRPLEQPPATLPAPQIFNTPERRGFTLVEWGGTRLP